MNRIDNAANQPEPDQQYPGSPPGMPGWQPDATEEPEPPSREGLRSIISTVLILLAAPLIALSLTAFVFQSYEVDGPSMETTLNDKDRLIVLKLPHTAARITNKPFIPERGEIIIFSRPGTMEFGERGDRQLIKRVIALPGERITVQDGVVTVFNHKNPGGFQPDNTLPYGDSVGATEGQNINVIVPENEVFVLGDNRGNSLDSRIFGPVRSEDIVGRLAVRILPLSKMQKF